MKDNEIVKKAKYEIGIFDRPSSDTSNELITEVERLEQALWEILCIEEEGHRFDSDEALSEIFNKCRDILN